MALIKCKECKKEVSSKADKCPNCGVDVKRKPAGCGTLLVLLLFAGVMANVWDSISTNTSPSKAADVKKTDGELKQDKLDADASLYCTLAVEGSAKYDFRWKSSFLTPRFFNNGTNSSDPIIITYSGDSIEMQNGFGDWINQVYQCDVNAITGEFIAITIEPGRLK